MREQEKELTREERMRRFHRQPTKYDWLYILSGKERDVYRFLSMILMNPGVFVLAVYCMTGKELDIFLTYLILDMCTVAWWAKRAVMKKRWMEETKDVDRTEIILQKIEELKAMEEEQMNFPK